MAGWKEKMCWRKKWELEKEERKRDFNVLAANTTELAWSGLHRWPMVSWEWRVKRDSVNVSVRCDIVYFLLYNTLSSIIAPGRSLPLSSFLCGCVCVFCKGGVWGWLGKVNNIFKIREGLGIYPNKPETRENILQLNCMELNVIKWY